MRIIAGKHGGRKLKEFKGGDVRPTSDRAREALFNILGNISESSFLDLFSGTGAIGLEAISRGACPVTMVDMSRESVTLIKENLSMLKETANIYTEDAYSFVKRTHVKYDFIFLDPPYVENAEGILESIAERKLLNDGGLLIYEHSIEKPFKSDKMHLIDSRHYGIAVFDFYSL